MTHWRQVVRKARRGAAAVRDAYDRRLLDSDVWIEHEPTDTQCLVRRHGDEALVACPGTQSWADALSDIRVWTREMSPLPGRWHGGAARGALAISPEVAAAVEGAEVVSIFGHSLGGMIAHGLGAQMAKLVHHKLVKWQTGCIHTFEAPRSCNRDAAQFLKFWWMDRSWRWTFGFSAVPSLIPPTGYRHVGQHLAVGGDGWCRRDPGTLRWFRELCRAVVRPGFNAIGDHGLDRTIGWLETAAVAVELPIVE